MGALRYGEAPAFACPPARRYGPREMGVGVADIFDEVNDDLRAERAGRLARRYGGAVAAAVLLIAGGVIGYEAWRGQQAKQTEAVATTYLTAVNAGAGGLPALTTIADTGPPGYRALAELQRATVLAQAKDSPGALAAWDRLARDTGADPLLRDLAALLWVQHQTDAGPADALLARLQPLTAPTNPWRALALETQSWILTRIGQTEQARLILAGLVVDQAAPEGVRGRANAMLARMPAPAGTGG